MAVPASAAGWTACSHYAAILPSRWSSTMQDRSAKVHKIHKSNSANIKLWLRINFRPRLWTSSHRGNWKRHEVVQRHFSWTAATRLDSRAKTNYERQTFRIVCTKCSNTFNIVQHCKKTWENKSKSFQVSHARKPGGWDETDTAKPKQGKTAVAHQCCRVALALATSLRKRSKK